MRGSMSPSCPMRETKTPPRTGVTPEHPTGSAWRSVAAAERSACRAAKTTPIAAGLFAGIAPWTRGAAVLRSARPTRNARAPIWCVRPARSGRAWPSRARPTRNAADSAATATVRSWGGVRRPLREVSPSRVSPFFRRFGRKNWGRPQARRRSRAPARGGIPICCRPICRLPSSRSLPVRRQRPCRPRRSPTWSFPR